MTQEKILEGNKLIAEFMGYDDVDCPNCKETKQPCACMRNICHKCGKPVGNITFTVCDDCWDKNQNKER